MKTARRSCLIAAALGVATALPARAQELPSGPLSLANGRVTIGADVSVSTSTGRDDPANPAQAAWFNYTDYEHNTLRLFRVGATTDIRLTDRISFLGEIRSENGDGVRPYAFYARVKPWVHRNVDIQAGRIPPTFGAFSRRAYGNGNPLIGYPLAYQYLTSLRPDAIPADSSELLRMRARGWRPAYRIGAQSISTGIPLISAFRWDTGVQVRLGADRLSVSTAVTNGTISDPRSKDNNGGKQVSTRVQWQPIVGLVLGGSGARGPYLSDDVASGRSLEQAAGFDFEYSRDHWLVRSEGVWVRWEMPTIAVPLDAGGAFVEGSYKIRPGVFVAGRADKLTFSRVVGALQTRSWDAPVTRVEAGVGAYVRRNFLVRTSFQQNWRDGGLIRTRKQLAVQLQFWL